MKHRLCALCGHHHPGVAHVWDALSPKPLDISGLVSDRPPKRVTAAEMTKTIDKVVEALSSPVVRAPRGTFDRVAYQREYMRKRRAKMKDNP